MNFIKNFNMNKLNKLSWYYNRVSLMSPVEITYRIKNKYKTAKERIFLKRKKRINFHIKDFNNFLFQSSDLEYIKRYYSNNLENKRLLFDKADKILNHKFSFFDLENEFLGQKINWHKDYKSKISCAPIFYADIDYKDYKKNGDIKYIWEINRFRQLYALSQAYCISEDKKYADEIVSQIDDWIDQNPYLTGVNWTSSLELAIRLIAWSWALCSIDAVGWNFDQSFENKVSQSIYQQAEYISNHLSGFSSANNHLIGEAAGLCIAGSLLNFGEKSKNWQKKGFEILLEELDKQIFSDGLNKEQTLAYHCFVFDFYILSFLILEKNGTKVPASAWKKLEKMAEIIFLFSDDNLNLPNIGDADDGYAVDLIHNHNDNDVKCILNTASILFQRGDFKQKAGNLLDEKTVWLLGENTCSKYEDIQAVKVIKESVFLDHSGYVILKDNEIDAVIDVGPLGYLSIAAHGHADALSLCVNYKGEKFLIDPGTYEYKAKEGWRNYFRGTSAHNTVEVDGLSQSELSGTFMWAKKAEVAVEKVLLKDEFNYIRASHNGYLKQGINVEHNREVLFQKNKFIAVVDRLYNLDNSIREHSLYWHLSDDWEIRLDPSKVLLNKKDKIANIWNFANVPITRKVLNGEINPICGWISPRYGYKTETNTIKLTTRSREKVIFVTVISFDTDIRNIQFSKNIVDISTSTEKYSYNLHSFLI